MQNSIKMVIAIFSFIVSIVVTNSFDIIKEGAWSGLANIFFYYPIYALVFTSIGAILYFISVNVLEYLFFRGKLIENRDKEKMLDNVKYTNDSLVNVVLNSFHNIIYFFAIVIGAVVFIVLFSKIRHFFAG